MPGGFVSLPFPEDRPSSGRFPNGLVPQRKQAQQTSAARPAAKPSLLEPFREANSALPRVQDWSTKATQIIPPALSDAGGESHRWIDSAPPLPASRRATPCLTQKRWDSSTPARRSPALHLRLRKHLSTRAEQPSTPSSHNGRTGRTSLPDRRTECVSAGPCRPPRSCSPWIYKKNGRSRRLDWVGPGACVR